MSEPCKKCGSQDVKWVEFTSKAGNDVKGWKCQEKKCGDMTFAPRAKSATTGFKSQNSGIVASGSDPKLDEILKTVKRIEKMLQEDLGIEKPLDEINKELQLESTEETPF